MPSSSVRHEKYFLNKYIMIKSRPRWPKISENGVLATSYLFEVSNRGEESSIIEIKYQNGAYSLWFNLHSARCLNTFP